MKIIEVNNINLRQKQNKKVFEQKFGYSLAKDEFVKSKKVSFTAVMKSPEIQKEIDFLIKYLNEVTLDSNNLGDIANEFSQRFELYEYNLEFLNDCDKLNTDKYFSKLKKKYDSQIKIENLDLLSHFLNHNKNKENYQLLVDQNQQHFDNEIKIESERVKNILDENDKKFEGLQTLSEAHKKVMDVYTGGDLDEDFYLKEYKPFEKCYAEIYPQVPTIPAIKALKKLEKGNFSIDELKKSEDYEYTLEEINYYTTHKEEIRAKIKAFLDFKFTFPKDETTEIFRKNWLERLNNAFMERNKKIKEIFKSGIYNNLSNFTDILANENEEIEKLTKLIDQKKDTLDFLPF